MRKQVTVFANKPLNKSNRRLPETTKAKASQTWAKLIARIYEVDPLLCTCGEKMQIIAFIYDQGIPKRKTNAIKFATAVTKEVARALIRSVFVPLLTKTL